MTASNEADRRADAPSISGGPRIGLGAMPLSTSGRPSRTRAIETIHRALDAGIRLIDTADAYCLSSADTGHNEGLVAEAVSTWGGPTNEVVLATKGGHVRDRAGNWHTDGRPEHIIAAARASRERLKVTSIRLYYFHRPDPHVPFLESVGALATLLEEGVVRSVGLSNVDVQQLDEAAALVDVAAVQNSFSPYDDSSLPVIDWCEQRGVPFVAWAPLGGAQRAGALGSDPKTAPHAIIAAQLGVSVAQIVLAWAMAFSPVIVTIPGARRPESIVGAAKAASIQLNDLQMRELRSAFSTAGS